jgi:hypothetical protein
MTDEARRCACCGRRTGAYGPQGYCSYGCAVESVRRHPVQQQIAPVSPAVVPSANTQEDT